MHVQGFKENQAKILDSNQQSLLALIPWKKSRGVYKGLHFFIHTFHPQPALGCVPNGEDNELTIRRSYRECLSKKCCCLEINDNYEQVTCNCLLTSSQCADTRRSWFCLYWNTLAVLVTRSSSRSAASSARSGHLILTFRVLTKDLSFSPPIPLTDSD